MENRLNKEVLDIQISGIRHFNNLANEMDDCIKFTLGEPDFSSHLHIKSAVRKALQNNMTHYSANAGLYELRKAICDDVYLRYGVSYDEDEVCVCVGASEALTSTLKTILNPGDEVIVFEPAYPAYQPLIRMNYATYVGINTCEDNFQINEETLRAHITKNTKAIILTSPNNPTGTIYNEASLEIIYNVVKDLNIFVVCDNIYDEITYGEFDSFLKYKDQREKIILIQSFSKAYAMAGYRLGYVCADTTIAAHIIKTHSYYVSGATTFVQYAGISALKTSNKRMVSEYKKRRDYALTKFEEMGLEVNVPDGAFYFFIDISKFNKNSYDFALDLLQRFKVCVIPGRCFGQDCDNYIRLSYACSMKQLQEGLARIHAYLENIDNE